MNNRKHSREIEELAFETSGNPSLDGVAPQVLQAGPGWRVIIEDGPDNEAPHGSLMIRPICCWILDAHGTLEPCYFDTHTPLLARKVGRIRAILAPGQREPMTDGEAATVRLGVANV